ncbi:hypothetical protein HN873_052416 [Arachis hypogaea]
MDNGSRYNVLYDDKEEETLEDINAGENEQISTMHSGPGIDLHMKEGEPSNPIQVEKPVAAKDIRPSLQVQKRVLKTGAGKNPQTHKKGLSFNLGPLKTRKATKPKLKEAEKKVIDIKKSLGVAQPSASASRNFKMGSSITTLSDTAKRFFPAALIFFLAIFTNTNLLHHANVDTFTVFQSLTHLLAALMDTVCNY